MRKLRHYIGWPQPPLFMYWVPSQFQIRTLCHDFSTSYTVNLVMASQKIALSINNDQYGSVNEGQQFNAEEMKILGLEAGTSHLKIEFDNENSAKLISPHISSFCIRTYIRLWLSIYQILLLQGICHFRHDRLRNPHIPPHGMSIPIPSPLHQQ